MRPTKRPVKPISQSINSLSIPQLQELLASNLRTLSNPALFPPSQSSTAPPDPLSQKLLTSNAQIRARLSELSVAEVTSELGATGLDGRAPPPPPPVTSESGPVKAQLGNMKVLSNKQSTHLASLEASRLSSLQSGSQSQTPSSLSPSQQDRLNPQRVRTHNDELGEIQKAARLNSFMHYTASDSDLEWDSDEPDDDEDEEDEDEIGAQEWQGIQTATPPNGHSRQASGVDQGGPMDVDGQGQGDGAVEIGEIVGVDLERMGGEGGLKVPRG